VVRDLRIDVDWEAAPPALLWRRSVGPGWSSFAVGDDRVYTQEQRGERESVASYDLATGNPVWKHSWEARFFEAMGGVGPRATPLLDGETIHVMGATGVLSALTAADGRVLWSRQLTELAGSSPESGETRVPIWGFSGSPLLVDGVLIVAASGRLMGFEPDTGELVWAAADGGPSYSSPVLVDLNGVPQVVLLHDAGAVSVVPEDGSVLWEHEWSGASLVQPAALSEGSILVSADEGKGIRRLNLGNSGDSWEATEAWTSKRLKPNFNDFVVHEGHAYGFDGGILASVELDAGTRRWKGGRYGHGQLVLLPDQDLLLVVSERGEVALVRASPDGFEELALFEAIEGKTWNHPVLVGDILLVRNAQEMAAFRLALTD